MRSLFQTTETLMVLERRVQELELRQLYPTTEDLAAAIQRAVVAAAKHSGEADIHRDEAEQELIALVRYAGRSGLLHE